MEFGRIHNLHLNLFVFNILQIHHLQQWKEFESRSETYARICTLLGKVESLTPEPS